MIETEEQRRWWFATHPEYSWSHRGIRTRGKREKEKEEESEKVRPEDVDAYVDEALKHVDGSVADLLKSVKRNFGTEGTKTSDLDDASEDPFGEDWWSQQPAGDESAEPQAPSDGGEGRIPWASAGPGAFAFLGAGSGWGTPAGAGGPDSSKLTWWEERLLSLQQAKEMSLRRLFDVRQAMQRFPGDQNPLYRWPFDPFKQPGFKDLLDISKQIAERFRRLAGTNETEAADKAVKALEDAAEAVDAVLDAAKSGGTRRPPRLPPKGTPEHAKIDAARSRGAKAKRREELADIEAGGKGSGVWSEEELEEIRQTRKFPDDVRWHHDPTVANRPDLADDPKVVHPLRGGDKAHLLKGHQGNYQNPKK